jgi:rSAM/selenodomain-associated transferase 1
MADALYIIAKAPRVGFAKTRLGRVIGHEAAVTLYKAFLSDLGGRFADAPFECGWYITPADAWEDILPLVGYGREARVLLQKEGDLTERQRELFLGAAARGEERVVLVASDSPHLTVGVVTSAFRELDRHDLVFGPTYDGGYYLIGMRGWHDVFHDIPMSVGTELDNIIARAEHAGLSVGRTEATFDIDEVEDLEHLRQIVEHRSDLAATRVALETLGLYPDGESTKPLWASTAGSEVGQPGPRGEETA